MKSEIKKKWLDALRSGNYEQGVGLLKSPEGQFCCLGVLCDLYIQETGTKWEKDKHSAPQLLGKAVLPPGEVMEWAGVTWQQFTLTIDGDKDEVWAFNDGYYKSDQDRPIRPKTFLEIADAIEQQVPEEK